MQQTIASTHFPKGKIERLTQKVTKLLSQKYKFDATQKTGADQVMRDIRLRHEDIQAAVQKTEKMNTKLKLIRTMLGYQYETSQKKQKADMIDNSQQKRLENKGQNLKQFVMSMRKRNELADKYFKNKRSNSIDQNYLTFDTEGRKIQEYTDDSLKYMHSFLPHHTNIDKAGTKGKKTLELATITPQKIIYPSTQSVSPSNILENSSETIQIPYPVQQSQEILLSAVRAKKSYSVATNYNSPTTKKSFMLTINQRPEHDIKKFGLAERKESISLPVVHHDSLHQKQQKLSNNTATLQICANRVTDSIYRGKHQIKDLKHILRNNRSGKIISSPSQQPSKALPQLFPVIKQCIPETRKHVNVPSP